MKNNEGMVTAEDILQDIAAKLDKIFKQMSTNDKTDFEFGFIDNYDLMKLLKISDRTALKLRKSKKIKYTKLNGKIFYKLSDVKDMLNSESDKK